MCFVVIPHMHESNVIYVCFVHNQMHRETNTTLPTATNTILTQRNVFLRHSRMTAKTTLFTMVYQMHKISRKTWRLHYAKISTMMLNRIQLCGKPCASKSGSGARLGPTCDPACQLSGTHVPQNPALGSVLAPRTETRQHVKKRFVLTRRRP